MTSCTLYLVPTTSPFDPQRRTALAVLVAGLLIAAAGTVLVFVLDFLPGFAAVAVGVLAALGAANRRSKIDLLEASGGYAASISELGARSWLPPLRDSGPPLGDGQGVSGLGNDGSNS